MQRPLGSHSQAGVSPRVSTHPRQEVPGRSTVLLCPVLRAFADGFGGGLIGGLMYCLALAYFNPDGVEFAWGRVLALSLTFVGFETWRVTRTPKTDSRRIGCEPGWEGTSRRTSDRLRSIDEARQESLYRPRGGAVGQTAAAERGALLTNPREGSRATV